MFRQRALKQNAASRAPGSDNWEHARINSSKTSFI